jgi:hypothetical protein
MKRLIAISFLFLLLFNAFGYYLLFGYEQRQERSEQLANLPESAFEIVRLPASLYVHLEDTDFEMVDDVYTIEGKTYQVVKRRIVNDKLEIYCLRDFRQDELNRLLADYAHEQGITQSDDSNSDAPTKSFSKNFLKEYLPLSPISIVKTTSNTEGGILTTISVADASLLSVGHFSIPSPPPNAA